jgi:hypothetical protein
MLLFMARMDLFSTWNRRAGALAAGIIVAASCPLGASEVDVLKTNLIDHWVTNLIEVRMPMNQYVNVYYTNKYQQFRTNFVDVYATNWSRLTVTNLVSVEAFHTNFTDDYHTNWVTLNLTNNVKVDAVRTNNITRYRTNLHDLRMTNEVAINEFHTNFVDRYRTNLKTLTLTNWEQVLVMKTNWISQQVTNVVQLDLVAKSNHAPESAPTEKEVAVDSTPPVQTSQTPPTTLMSEGIEIRATLESRSATPSQPEVLLWARLGTDPSVVLHVEQWRVEKGDATILLFSQSQEFKRQLPLGKYNVDVRVKRDINGPVLAGHGVLDLSSTSAVMQQKLLGQN